MNRIVFQYGVLGIVCCMGAGVASAQKMDVVAVVYPNVQSLISKVPLRGAQLVVAKTQLNANNNDGVAIGSEVITVGGTQDCMMASGCEVQQTWAHALLYAKSKFEVIDGPLAQPSSTAGLGINNQGQALIAQSAPDGLHYFIYSLSQKTFTPISLTGEFVYNGKSMPVTLSTVTGFNDKGEIAGPFNQAFGFFGAPAVGVAGSLAPPAGKATFTLIQCPGNQPIFVGAMNNSDQIAGTCGGRAGFLYRNGSMTLFHDQNLMTTVARGINNQGIAVGQGEVHPRAGAAFRYDGTAFSYVSDKPDGSDVKDAAFDADAYGINDSGQVVGRMGRLEDRSFIATPQR